MEETPKNHENSGQGGNNEAEELAKMPSFEEHMKSFREARDAGELPDGVRDEQDYREYLEEQHARNTEMRNPDDIKIEKVLAEMDDEDSELRFKNYGIILGGNFAKYEKDIRGARRVERSTMKKYAIWQTAKDIANADITNLDWDEESILRMKFDILANLWKGESLDAQKLTQVSMMRESLDSLLANPDAQIDDRIKGHLRCVACMNNIDADMEPHIMEYAEYEHRQ